MWPKGGVFKRFNESLDLTVKHLMGTWGIARDMAKLNEENLSKLSRKGMYEKLKIRGSKSKSKVYKFKKATPDLLEKIKQRKFLEMSKLRKKKAVLLFFCALVSTIFLILIFHLEVF